MAWYKKLGRRKLRTIRKKGLKKYRGRSRQRSRSRSMGRGTYRNGALKVAKVYQIAKKVAMAQIRAQEKVYTSQVETPEIESDVWTQADIVDTRPETNRQAVMVWFPNLQLPIADYQQPVVAGDLTNPKRIQVQSYRASLEIVQENVANDLKYIKYYKIVPKRKLFNNRLLFDEFRFDFAEVSVKTWKPASAGYLALVKWGFKMNEEDIFNENFNDYFQIVKIGQCGKGFPTQKMINNINATTGLVGTSFMYEQKEFLNNKLHIYESSNIKTNLIRPDDQDETFWSDNDKLDQFAPEQKYAFYLFMPVSTQFNTITVDGSVHLTTTMISFSMDNLIVQYKAYDYTPSQQAQVQAMMEVQAMAAKDQQQQDVMVEEDANGIPKSPLDLRLPEKYSDAVNDYLGIKVDPNTLTDLAAKTKYYEQLALERDAKHRKYGK